MMLSSLSSLPSQSAWHQVRIQHSNQYEFLCVAQGNLKFEFRKLSMRILIPFQPLELRFTLDIQFLIILSI